MEFDNTDRGALFKNKKKERDSQPDYQGNLDVGGVEYWISAWIKEAKSGMKFMSLSVTMKDGQQAKPAAAPQPQPQQTKVVEDDLPF